jgi:PQQ-dependent catabolism-associated CXXCW motif protein
VTEIGSTAVTAWLARWLAVALVAVLPSGARGDATPPVPEPAGYRLEDYRAPVPATVAGGTAIDTAAADALWRQGRAVFIDVLPAPRRPETLRADALWKPLPRRDVPGSLWLPDVGRGELNAALEDYFRKGLDRATRGDANAALVLYCLADCWMSWNAAKRAAAWGYRAVYWYRDGTTGWEAAGSPVALAGIASSSLVSLPMISTSLRCRSARSLIRAMR